LRRVEDGYLGRSRGSYGPPQLHLLLVSLPRGAGGRYCQLNWRRLKSCTVARTPAFHAAIRSSQVCSSGTIVLLAAQDVRVTQAGEELRGVVDAVDAEVEVVQPPEREAEGRCSLVLKMWLLPSVKRRLRIVGPGPARERG